MGALETAFADITAQLARIEQAIADLRTGSGPTGDPALDIWSLGALGIPEAAAEFSISETTLREWMVSGELPYAQPTRRRVVPRRWFLERLAEGVPS